MYWRARGLLATETKQSYCSLSDATRAVDVSWPDKHYGYYMLS